MTSFQDGPAKGQHLMLHRSVRFLRVTEELGTWDALDNPEDIPRPSETIYAYEIVGTPSMCHIRASKGSGFYAMATYRFVPNQPTDAEMRSFEAWRQWCDKQQ